jgi:hypothetical protein
VAGTIPPIAPIVQGESARAQGGFILGFLVGRTSETIQNPRFKIQKERAMRRSVPFLNLES